MLWYWTKIKEESLSLWININIPKKCLEMLNTKQFSEISVDRKKRQTQRSKELYKKSKASLKSRNTFIYAVQVLALENFMVLLWYKNWKLNDKVDQLPIKLTVFSSGTATYNLARLLTKLLSPLSNSKYTIDSTKHFMENIKQETIPDRYKMAFFYVNWLFTNVPLETNIDIILERIYDRKKINTQINTLITIAFTKTFSLKASCDVIYYYHHYCYYYHKYYYYHCPCWWGLRIHWPLLQCFVRGEYSFRESIQVPLSILKRFWIDFLLIFTMATT